jgi:hypothetical protein
MKYYFFTPQPSSTGLDGVSPFRGNYFFRFFREIGEKIVFFEVYLNPKGF